MAGRITLALDAIEQARLHVEQLRIDGYNERAVDPAGELEKLRAAVEYVIRRIEKQRSPHGAVVMFNEKEADWLCSVLRLEVEP
jgi:hypothetical protein